MLDTDVFSITSPVNGLATAEVALWRAWVARNQDMLYFSVVTVMEIRFGIEKLHSKGATDKARQLQHWLTAAETAYRDRLIPVSVEIAHRAGELLHRAVAAGRMPGSEDAIIAATAEVSGFKLLSRNAADMRTLTGNWLNPLDAALPDAGM